MIFHVHIYVHKRSRNFKKIWQPSPSIARIHKEQSTEHKLKTNKYQSSNHHYKRLSRDIYIFSPSDFENKISYKKGINLWKTTMSNCWSPKNSALISGKLEDRRLLFWHRFIDVDILEVTITIGCLVQQIWIRSSQVLYWSSMEEVKKKNKN